MLSAAFYKPAFLLLIATKWTPNEPRNKKAGWRNVFSTKRHHHKHLILRGYYNYMILCRFSFDNDKDWSFKRVLHHFKMNETIIFDQWLLAPVSWVMEWLGGWSDWTLTWKRMFLLNWLVSLQCLEQTQQRKIAHADRQLIAEMFSTDLVFPKTNHWAPL